VREDRISVTSTLKYSARPLQPPMGVTQHGGPFGFRASAISWLLIETRASGEHHLCHSCRGAESGGPCGQAKRSARSTNSLRCRHVNQAGMRTAPLGVASLTGKGAVMAAHTSVVHGTVPQPPWPEPGPPPPPPEPGPPPWPEPGPPMPPPEPGPPPPEPGPPPWPE
jgi:hypothetical protein